MIVSLAGSKIKLKSSLTIVVTVSMRVGADLL